MTALEQMVFSGIFMKFEVNFQGDSWEVDFNAQARVGSREILRKNWELQ
jgi:hypothetical protein